MLNLNSLLLLEPRYSTWQLYCGIDEYKFQITDLILTLIGQCPMSKLLRLLPYTTMLSSFKLIGLLYFSIHSLKQTHTVIFSVPKWSWKPDSSKTCLGVD